MRVMIHGSVSKSIVFLHILGSQAAVQAGDARRVASLQAQLPPQLLDLWKPPGSTDEDQAGREPDQKAKICAQCEEKKTESRTKNQDQLDNLSSDLLPVFSQSLHFRNV